MKHISLSLILISFALIFTQCKKDDNKTPTPIPKYNLISIQTDFGDMVIWLYESTPNHKDNFITLTLNKFYDSLIFHYIQPHSIIIGGDPKGDGTGGTDYTIPAEFSDSITHVYGAVCAARLPDGQNPEKSSNGSQFYIVANKSGMHSRDKNYTVFGQVISGLSVVDTISVLDRDLNNKPAENVYMKKVEIVQYTDEELKTQFNFVRPKNY